MNDYIQPLLTIDLCTHRMPLYKGSKPHTSASTSNQCTVITSPQSAVFPLISTPHKQSTHTTSEEQCWNGQKELGILGTTTSLRHCKACRMGFMSRNELLKYFEAYNHTIPGYSVILGVTISLHQYKACRMGFTSRNQLFRHIKSFGHVHPSHSI